MRRIINKFKKFIFSTVILAVVFQSGFLGVIFPIEKAFAALPETWANHVVISEIYVDAVDESKSEFIELYNPTANSINIGGWVIKTDASPADATLPAGASIPAYGFYLIADAGWSTGKDNASWPAADYEETINLYNSNAGISLLNGGVVVDAVGYGSPEDISGGYEGTPLTNNQIIEGKSLERKPGTSRSLDGNGIDTDNNSADFDLRTSPQPQNSSNTEVPDYDAPVTSANPAGGTYTSAQSVTLTATDENSTTIYYTTDGSTPTTSSPTYSSPILISSTTTLKFFAVDSHGNEESIKTENYIINTDTTKPTASIISATANNQQIVLQFSEVVNSSAASTITNYKLSRDGGMSFDDLTSENANISYDSEDYKVTITIIAGINFNTGDDLVLAISTNIEDLAGNPMDENKPDFPGYYYTESYTATSGETPPLEKPVVSSVSFSEGKDEEPETLIITFSKDIATIGEASDYTVVYDSDANFSTTEDQRSVSVISVANAGNDETVELTIEDQSQQTDAGGKFKVAVSENVKDGDGNSVDQTNGNNIGYSPTINSFDTNKPTIDSDPAVLFVEYKNQQNDVLTITFSKKMGTVGSVSDYQVIYDADGDFNTIDDWRIVTVESVELSEVDAKKIDLTIADQSHFTDAGGKFKVIVSENVKDVAGNGVDQDKNVGYSAIITSFDNYAPEIESVTLSPSEGVLVIGDSITITVTEKDRETGLVATGKFNNKDLKFTDNNDGTYTAVYTVEEGDEDAFNVEANVKLTDPAGYYDEAVSSGNSVNIHTQPPTNLSISINNGASRTNSRKVTLSLHADDNFGDIWMQFSDDNQNWGNWEEYATSKTYTLPSGDGKKTVYVRFKDSAGYISETVSDSIILDTTAPTEDNLVIYKAPAENEVIVQGDSIFLSGKTGAFFTVKIYVYSNPVTYQTQASSTGYWEYEIPTNKLEEGDHEIYIQLIDLAGNVSDLIKIASFSIIIPTEYHAYAAEKPEETVIKKPEKSIEEKTEEIAKSPQSTQPEVEVKEETTQKKSKWWIWVSAIVGFIILVVAGYLFFDIYRKRKSEQQKLF